MKRFTLIMVAVTVLVFLFANCESPALKGGKVYLSKGQTEKAKEQFMIAVQTNPNDAEAHWLLGRSYMQEENYEKMNEHFNIAASISPSHKISTENDRRSAYTNIFSRAASTITAAENEQDPDRKRQIYLMAIEHLNKSLRIDDKLQVYESLAVSYINLDDMVKAEEYLILVIERDPKNYNGLSYMGLIAYNDAITTDDVEKYSEAIKYWEQFIAEYPKQRIEVVELGICYEKTDQPDKAIDYYNVILEEQPDNINILIQRGAVKFKKGDRAGGLTDFRKALELEPDNILIMRNIALPMFFNVYEKTGDKTDTDEEWEALLPYLEKISEVEKENADVWEMLAITYTKLDMLEKAAIALKNYEKYKGVIK